MIQSLANSESTYSEKQLHFQSQQQKQQNGCVICSKFKIEAKRRCPDVFIVTIVHIRFHMTPQVECYMISTLSEEKESA